MLAAIHARRDWRKSNTRVSVNKAAGIAKVWLYESLICLYFYNTGLRLYSGDGFRTLTTKSRLNALGAGIYQRQGEWYNSDGTPFRDNDLYSIYFREKEIRMRDRDKNLFK